MDAPCAPLPRRIDGPFRATSAPLFLPVNHPGRSLWRGWSTLLDAICIANPSASVAGSDDGKDSYRWRAREVLRAGLKNGAWDGVRYRARHQGRKWVLATSIGQITSPVCHGPARTAA